jgi:hypothetical protein
LAQVPLGVPFSAGFPIAALPAKAFSFLSAVAPALCLTHLGDHLGGERRVPRTRSHVTEEGEGRTQAENSLINISEVLSLQLLGPSSPTTCAGGGRRMGKEKETKPRKQI